MRYASLVFCLVLILALSACSSDETPPTDGDTSDGDSEDGDVPSDGDTPDSCPADVYVCQGTQVYHCGDDGKWAYFLDCAERGDYICKNGLCVDPSQPDGDIPDGDWPDGDWPDGDIPDMCQGDCDLNVDTSYCLPDGNLCFCEPHGWDFYNCDEVCANANMYSTGCSEDGPGIIPFCACEVYPDGDIPDGDPDYPFCERECLRTSDCSSGEICGAGGCCSDPCYVTGCPSGGSCNPNNGYCEWCDPPCPANQRCNYHEDFWYCGSPCEPPCDDGFACQGGRCTALYCPPCDAGQYCSPDTGYHCINGYECYGDCNPNHVNNECLDTHTLCVCDPDIYEWTVVDCDEICRESGYAGAENCENSLQTGSGVCYCYIAECQRDSDCIQAGTGDYCLNMGQSYVCAPRCDIASCPGLLACVDIGIGDGCGACMDLNSDPFCNDEDLDHSCGTDRMCHDICGLYEPICSKTCDAIPNSCDGPGQLCWPLPDDNGGILDGVCVDFGARCPDCSPPDTAQTKLCVTEVTSIDIPNPICFEIGNQTLMAYEQRCSPCETIPADEPYTLTVTDCQGNELGAFDMPALDSGVSLVYAIGDYGTDAVIYIFDIPADEQSCSSISYEQVLDLVETQSKAVGEPLSMPITK